jgi:hypothetical protein
MESLWQGPGAFCQLFADMFTLLSDPAWLSSPPQETLTVTTRQALSPQW